jgi:peptidoglycan glycosyltransferase
MRKKNTNTTTRKNRRQDDIEIQDIPIDEEPQPEVLDHKKKNRELVRVSYLFVLMFLSLAAYLIYFNIYKRDDINSNVNNTKQESQQDQIIRGSILSADGEILAGTNVYEDGTEERVYPFSNIFAHVVGYATNGKAGVESSSNFDLLSSHASILEQVREQSLDTKVRGDNVVLTLDSRLQTVCYNALGSYNGAVVVIEPDTGKILAMVSKPDFDPNTISSDWEDLVSDSTNSSLFNRATQGQYPPGSTFKILTTLAYLREHPDDYQSFTYNCNGSISRDDVTITCYGGEVHGTVDLATAFEESCNGAFAEIGMELDNGTFKELCEDFQFNQDLPITLPSATSLFTLEKGASYGEEMMTAIGQGNTVVSPLEMALVAATVANGGNMMKPYLIDYLETYDGDLVKQNKPTIYKELMSTEEAKILAGFMEKTVESGTASQLSGQSYTAAGKTGSAEYEVGDSTGTHSWFVGYSNVDDPDLAIAVIAENGGSGSSTAVPIAKAIFDAYYNDYYSGY